MPSPVTDAIGDACREAGVVVSIGVNERDGGTLYNTQLLFDADGTLIQRRRKTTPTYHERMVWGQGDGSGLRAVDSRGRPHRSAGVLGALQPSGPLRADRRRRADPLRHVSGLDLRRSLRPADGDQRSAACAGVRVLRGLRDGLAASRSAGADRKDTGRSIGPISGGCFTAIVAPDGTLMGEPIARAKVSSSPTSTSRSSTSASS